MSANSIVPDLDVFEYRRLRDHATFPNRIAKFALHRAEETVNAGIVPAVALAAHAWLEPARFQEGAKLFARILASAIGVEDRARSCAAPSNRITHRIDHQTSIHGRLQRPSDNETRGKINNNGKIKPALARLCRYVMSPAHTRFGWRISATSNLRARRLSAIGRS